jgi:hypothetical protein
LFECKVDATKALTHALSTMNKKDPWYIPEYEYRGKRQDIH